MVNKTKKIKKPIEILPETSTDQWDLRLDFDFPEVQALLDQVRSLFVEDNQTSGKIVKGGWGTGKTHFRKYVESIGNEKKSILIESSMSRICNVYDDKNNNYSDLIQNNSNPSVRFLSAFFISAEESMFIEPKYKQNFNIFKDPIKYVNSYLNTIFESNNHKFLTLFIDEMEELNKRNNSNLILQDLASIFNEEQMNWGVGQKFGGMVKIFLACTPQAYEKLKTNQDLEQNLGKIEGRMKFIELPVFSRRQGLNFIFAYYKHFFDNNDSTYPFDDISTLHSLVNYSRKNFRNLMDLLTLPIRDEISKSEDGKISIFSSSELFNYYLENKTQVQITSQMKNPLINIDNYNDILKILRKEIKIEEDYQNFIHLFKILISNLKPLNIKEISQRLENNGIKLPKYHIKMRIEALNDLLKKLDIDGLRISKYYQIDPDKIEFPLFTAFLSNISSTLGDNFVIFEENSEKYIRIASKNIIPIRDYEDLFVFYGLKETFRNLSDLPTMSEEIYYPCTKDDTQYEFIFPKIDQYKIGEIIRKLVEISLKDEEEEIEYYLPNSYLLSYIFPEPVPKFLYHIKDPKEISDILEKSRKQLEELSNLNFTSTFIKYLQNFPTAEFQIISTYEVRCNDFIFSELKTSVKFNNQKFGINIWLIFSVSINDGIIRQIYTLYNQKLSLDKEKTTEILPHLVFFIGHQQFEIDKSKFKLTNPYQIETFHITRDYIRRFIMLKLALDKTKSHLHENIYGSFQNEDLKELDLTSTLIKILNKLDTKIYNNNLFYNKQLINETPKKMIQILSWFINCNCKNQTPAEVWDWNDKNIRHFQIFGTKLSSLSMIDFDSSEQFKNQEISSLFNFNYLEKANKTDKLILIDNPFEKRCIDILKYLKPENGNDLIKPIDFIKRFYILPENNKLFLDFFIEILFRKGKIEKFTNKSLFEIRLRNINNLREKLSINIPNIKNELNNYTFGTIYSSKKNIKHNRTLLKSEILEKLDDLQKNKKSFSPEKINSNIILLDFIEKNVLKTFKKGQSEFLNLKKRLSKKNEDKIHDFFNQLKNFLLISKNSSPRALSRKLKDLNEIDELENKFEDCIDCEIENHSFIEHIKKENYILSNRENFPFCLPQLEITHNIVEQIFSRFNPINDFCTQHLENLKLFNSNIDNKQNQLYKFSEKFENYFNMKKLIIDMVNILGNPQIVDSKIDFNNDELFLFSNFQTIVKTEILDKITEFNETLESLSKILSIDLMDNKNSIDTMNRNILFLNKLILIIITENQIQSVDTTSISKNIQIYVQKTLEVINQSGTYDNVKKEMNNFKSEIISWNKDVASINAILESQIENFYLEVEKLNKIRKEIKKLELKNIKTPIKIISEIFQDNKEYLDRIYEDIDSLLVSFEGKEENIILEYNPLDLKTHISKLINIRDEILKNLDFPDEEIIKLIPRNATNINRIIEILQEKAGDRVPNYKYGDWKERLLSIWEKNHILMFLSQKTD